MIDLKCDVLTPKTLNNALQLLSNADDHTKILAGGTDVIVGKTQGSKRFVNTKVLIDINYIPEMKIIEANDEIISIGASTTFNEIFKNKIVEENLPLLKKAASMVGSQQIRNRATIAGNFVNNAPCADIIPTLLVYDARIEIKSLNSARTILLQDFLEGPYKTQLQKDELVTRILIPRDYKNYLGEYYKLGRRRAVAISRLTLAILIHQKEKSILDIKIASGALTPIGTRFLKLEEYAKGQIISEDLCKELAKKMGEEVLSVTGLRWSSAYKLPVVQQMFFQLLKGIEH